MTDERDAAPITAVLWDFGGVITSSPFEAFAAYEAAHQLPVDLIRRVNSTNPDDNAWARLERSEISTVEFDQAFADESAALGYRVPGSDVLALLSGTVRRRVVAALDAVRAAGYKTACLTNNIIDTSTVTQIGHVLDRFDVVVESSKVGLRKPQPEFYELACRLLDVSPAECVFVDDLGINLKPAAAMGMRTIKALDADQVVDDLAAVLGIALPG